MRQSSLPASTKPAGMLSSTGDLFNFRKSIALYIRHA